MDHDTRYLIDDIVRYSERKKLTIDRAANQLAELAKQRLPEIRLEQEYAAQRNILLAEIRESGYLSLIIRVPMVTWIHEVHWRYFPKFHVISNAREEYAFPISLDIDTWPPTSPDTSIYLDDLYYDEEAERFWQDEPFLQNSPLSRRAYQHLKSRRLKNLSGTTYRKADPKIVSRVIEARKGIPNYSTKRCESDKLYGDRPFGALGWRARMSNVTKIWSLKRKSDWVTKH